jgi:glutamine amidotransferase
MKQFKVTVLDYGVGNLLSVKRGLEHFGAEVKVTSECRDIQKADRLVFPGVGAFPNAMQTLEKLGLIDPIKVFVKTGKPFMAICLGMQLLMEESGEFQITKGLGMIKGKVTKLPSKNIQNAHHKVPHIGWSKIQPGKAFSNWNSTLLEDNAPHDYAYFVHSYHVLPLEPATILATTNFNGIEVVAAVKYENITAFQFHPEKSSNAGLKILNRFCNE